MSSLNPLAYLLLMVGEVTSSVCNLYGFILMLYIVLKLLVQLGVVNAYKPRFRGLTVNRVLSGVGRLYEPALQAIGRKVPSIANIDFSPLILWLTVQFLGYTLYYIFVRLAMVVNV
jgi:uncharacterized protein YggT (Ycf19 family)